MKQLLLITALLCFFGFEDTASARPRLVKMKARSEAFDVTCHTPTRSLIEWGLEDRIQRDFSERTGRSNATASVSSSRIGSVIGVVTLDQALSGMKIFLDSPSRKPKKGRARPSFRYSVKTISGADSLVPCTQALDFSVSTGGVEQSSAAIVNGVFDSQFHGTQSTGGAGGMTQVICASPALGIVSDGIERFVELHMRSRGIETYQSEVTVSIIPLSFAQVSLTAEQVTAGSFFQLSRDGALNGDNKYGYSVSVAQGIDPALRCLASYQITIVASSSKAGSRATHQTVSVVTLPGVFVPPDFR